MIIENARIAREIRAELSSYQGIFLSSYSTNFNVHYSLAFRSPASTRAA